MRGGGLWKGLRDKLPKDIVICDWHYKMTKLIFHHCGIQARRFSGAGCNVEKPKTIRNFSHYAAAHGAYGMIATTWSHVQRKEWDEVQRIINESGETFSKDFPDGK